MRRFDQLELSDDALPDETTILKFRHLLERHGLTSQMMNVINDTLEERGLLLKGGTMVDATIIHAAPSTKNRAKQRDPEMHQTKKGNQWYFGMKIHVGADAHSGLAHTVSVTSANVADVTEFPHLLREDDRAVFGDKGYVNNSFKQAGRKAGVFWGVALKASSQHPLTAANKRFNHRMSSIRSARRTPVSGDQAPVRLHEGALQRIGKERRAGVLTDRFDHPLPHAIPHNS